MAFGTAGAASAMAAAQAAIPKLNLAIPRRSVQAAAPVTAEEGAAGHPSLGHALAAWLFGGSTPMDDERAKVAATTQAAGARTAEKELDDWLAGVGQGPQVTAPRTMGPDVGGEPSAPAIPMKAGAPSLRDPATLARLAKALGAGANVEPRLKMLEAMQPRPNTVMNTAKGVYSIDPEGGSAKPLVEIPLKGDDPLQQELLRAQIAAARAQADQRTNQGAYYGAKAAQPYAPQHPRASGGGGSGNSGALQAIEAELRRRGKIP